MYVDLTFVHRSRHAPADTPPYAGRSNGRRVPRPGGTAVPRCGLACESLTQRMRRARLRCPQVAGGRLMAVCSDLQLHNDNGGPHGDRRHGRKGATNTRTGCLNSPAAKQHEEAPVSVPNAAPEPHIPASATQPITGPSHIRMHTLLGLGPWYCRYCETPLTCPCFTGEDGNTFWRNRNNVGATLDHIVPTTRGGSDRDDNVVPSCMPCNSSKNDRIWPDEWVPGIDNATFIFRAEITPEWGSDSLGVHGLLALLAALEPGRRYGLHEVALLVPDKPAAIRAGISKLAWSGRLRWAVVPAVERPFEHEFSAVAK